jgi:hypothetical protein
MRLIQKSLFIWRFTALAKLGKAIGALMPRRNPSLSLT